MRATAGALVAVLVVAAAAPSDARTPYRLTEPRLAVTLGGALSLGAAAVLLERDPPAEPPPVPAIDAWSLGADSSGAALASDVLLALYGAAPVVVSAGLVGGGGEPFEDWGVDSVVYLQAQAVNVALTMLAKRLVRRPRPYTYADGYDWSRSSPSATYAFWSGHTSVAFCSAAALSMSVGERYPRHAPWVWSLSMAGAAAAGALRVAAGKHHLTDVLVGAAVGTGIGILVPWLYRRSDSSSGGGSAEAPVGFALSGSF